VEEEKGRRREGSQAHLSVEMEIGRVVAICGVKIISFFGECGE
jgi:hypothetical protein